MRDGTSKSPLFWVFLSFLVVAFTHLVCPSSAPASDNDAVLAQIMRDWQARRHAMARVRYVVKGTRLIPKGTLTEVVRVTQGIVAGDIPPSDDVAKTSLDMLIDVARNRFRIDEYEPPQPGFEDDLNRRTSHRVNFYDGTNREVWYPDMDDSRVQLIFAPGTNGSLEPYWLPVFFAHGFVAPNRMFSRVLQQVRLSPEGFSVHSKVVQDGKELVVLRSRTGNTADSAWFEWWVDLHRQSAVTRMSNYVDASHRLRTFEIQYAKHERGWLPASWRMQVFSADDSNTVELVRTFSVEEIVVDPTVSDAMFSKRTTPGMIVRNSRTRRVYVVAKDGSPGPDFATILRSKMIADVRQSERTLRRWGWMTMLIGGIVLVGIASFYCVRRRTPRRNP